MNSVLKVFDVVGFRNLFVSVREGVSTALTCLSCHSLATLILNNVISSDSMALAFHEVCLVLRLTSPRVCVGIVEQMKDHVDFIRQNSRLKATEVCGALLGSQCYIGRSNNLFWRLDIPEKTVVDSNVDSGVGAHTLHKRDKIRKILHLTDIHLDLEYQIGSDIECNEPICCRTVSNNSPNITAGHWGSYPCDIPLQTLNNAFEEISKNAAKVDLWYWTGDIVAHDIWQYSQQNSIKHIQLLTQLLQQYSAGRLIVPVVGNHESVPINWYLFFKYYHKNDYSYHWFLSLLSFPPPSVAKHHSIQWLYNSLSKQWSQWLPEDAQQLLRFGGYYTLVINPGFRVIVVNTNYCARLNIWTYYDSVDPGDQLKWLIKELLLAEKAGDFVHIVGHVPVDNRECTQAWVYNYLSIIERFSDTIVGQFFGHTHADEFRVLYSNDNQTKPIGFEILSPSLTTFDTFNPSYRIISINQRGIIKDIETFFFNLSQANDMSSANGSLSSPVWYYEYSMRKEYSLENFTSNSFNRLINQLLHDNNYLQKFYSHYYRFSDRLKNDFCDNDCKDKFINDIIIGNPFEKSPKSFLHRG